MKDNIIDGQQDYKDIGLRGFDYKLFGEEEGGRTRQGLYAYHYLKYPIQLCSGDWVKQMTKIDEAVGIKNRYTMDGGGKRLFCHFKRQEFCKFVGCIISEVINGNKVHKLWIYM